MDSSVELNEQELMALPLGAQVTVIEASQKGLNKGSLGYSATYEVGMRQSKKVLYRLPHKSSYLSLRKYCHFVMKRAES